MLGTSSTCTNEPTGEGFCVRHVLSGEVDWNWSVRDSSDDTPG